MNSAFMYLDEHARMINFFLNIAMLTIIPILVFGVKRWLLAVVTKDTCNVQMTHLDAMREKRLMDSFMPKEDIKELVADIKCDIEKVDANINTLRGELKGQVSHLNDAFIRHINGHGVK